jgi:hypothetical protein
MSENESSSAGADASPLDRAIDRAVRQMVQVDPAAGLDRRVRARLSRPVAQRSPGMRYLVFAGALAMLVLAVGILRHGRSGVEIPVTPQAPTAVQATRQPSGGTTALGVGMSPAVKGPSPATGSRQPRTRRPAEHGRAQHAEVIPMPEVASVFGTPSDAVAGATVAGAEDVSPAGAAGAPASRIEITRLSIAPLEIPPLRIAPIPAAQKQP